MALAQGLMNTLHHRAAQGASVKDSQVCQLEPGVLVGLLQVTSEEMLSLTAETEPPTGIVMQTSRAFDAAPVAVKRILVMVPISSHPFISPLFTREEMFATLRLIVSDLVAHHQIDRAGLCGSQAGGGWFLRFPHAADEDDETRQHVHSGAAKPKSSRSMKPNAK